MTSTINKLIQDSDNLDKEEYRGAKVLCHFQAFHFWKVETDLNNVNVLTGIAFKAKSAQNNYLSVTINFINGKLRNISCRKTLGGPVLTTYCFSKRLFESIWLYRFQLHAYKFIFNSWCMGKRRGNIFHIIKPDREVLLIEDPQPYFNEIDPDSFLQIGFRTFFSRFFLFFDKDMKDPITIDDKDNCMEYIAFGKVPKGFRLKD